MGVLRAVGVVVAMAVASVAPALAAASAAPAMTAAPDPHPRGLFYAALGDSYASGQGLPPYTNQPASGCLQSAENYAHQVASGWELQLSDSSCSGAVSANIAETPQQTGEATAPLQVEALSSDTRVVTVTIGGNDLGFAGIVEYCTALSAQGPIAGDPDLADCRSHFRPNPGTDLLKQRLTDVVAPAVGRALTAIAAAAPDAVVIVVGYPAITPDAAHVPAGGCFRPALPAVSPPPGSGSPGAGSSPFAENAFPFTDVDVLYLHSVETALNATLRQQAEAAGAMYVDVFEGSQAHSACAPASDAYVNGLTLRRLDGATPPVPGGGETPVPGEPAQANIDVQPGSLHPNSAGVGYLAAHVRTAMKAAFPAPAPEPTPDDSSTRDTPKEWAFPVDVSQPAVIGVLACLLVAAGVGTAVWRRHRQQQDAASSRDTDTDTDTESDRDRDRDRDREAKR